MMFAPLVMVVALFLPSVVSAQGPDTIDGVQRHRVSAAGIALETPAAWQVLELSPEQLEELQGVLEAENPDVPRLGREQNKLWVIDPGNGDSVEVDIVDGLFFLFSKRLVAAAIEETGSSLPGFELVSVDKLKVDGKKAFRADYRYELDQNGSTVPVYNSRLVLAGGAGELVLVITEVDDTPASRAVADQILESVERL